MSDSPASPKANRLATPGWLDGRLVLGVLLVLVSVVVGARVLSSADRTQLVWAATGDLAVGSQLQEGDLKQVRVRLFERSGDYVRVSAEPPYGYVVRRGVGADELLPLRSLTRPETDVDFRYVTVPVQPGHYPTGLDRNQQVDVWLTPELEGRPAAATPGASPRPEDGSAAVPPDADALQLSGAQQVLSQVTVLTGPPRGSDFASAGAAVPIELQVRPADVAKLMSAMSLGRIDIVRVPRESEASGDLLPPAEAG